jgi:hypothetical protein
MTVAAGATPRVGSVKMKSSIPDSVRCVFRRNRIERFPVGDSRMAHKLRAQEEDENGAIPALRCAFEW